MSRVIFPCQSCLYWRTISVLGVQTVSIIILCIFSCLECTYYLITTPARVRVLCDYEHWKLCCNNSLLYSATHKQLDSPRMSRASRTWVAREYSHTHTRVLARVHVSTRKCTRSHSNACTRFTRSGHASLIPKPSTFFRGGRGLGIDAIDTR